MRATHAREALIASYPHIFTSSLHSPTLIRSTSTTPNHTFWKLEMALYTRSKKNLHFSAIFSLFGAISPLIPIGAHGGGAHHFPFSFTAKATPTYTQTLLTTLPNDSAHKPPLSNQKVAL